MFGWLAREGPVEEAEMLRAFNCGVGMAIIVAEDGAEAVAKILAEAGSRERLWAGQILNGLPTRDMRLVAHVLRVIRRRLRRDEQERLHEETKRDDQEST